MNGSDPFYSVRFGGTTINYRLRRSYDRETVAITVGQGLVSVAAPSGMRAAAVEPIVLSKAAWIVTKLDEDRRLRKQWPRKLVSGESIAYLGRQYLLKVTTANERGLEGVRLYAGVLHLTLPRDLNGDASTDRGRTMIRQWLKNHLKTHLLGPVADFSKSLALEPPPFQVRDLGGRWGSCSNSGRLSFHWHLASVPPRLIAYVAAHELCHLIEPHHNRAFFRLLSRIMPEWQKRHEELNKWIQII